MDTPLTALVILNWNGKQLLERFLPSVVRHTPGFVQLVVADNASSDGSLEFLHRHYPEVKIISMKRNLGFAGGYNEALKQLEADYFILLNSDIKVTPDWVDPLLGLMLADPGVAACQPKILSLASRNGFEYAGASGGFIDILGYPFCRGRIFQQLEEDHGQYDHQAEVFWASGAALCIRREAFFRAGGFDERFFAHMEEVDLCWRLLHLGYRNIACPRSVVYHLGGGSLPASNPRKTFLNFRNSLFALAKNLPAHYFYPVFIARLALDWLAAVKFFFGGKWGDALAVFRAQGGFFRYFRQMRAQSRGVPGSLPPQMYRGSIVMDYYLRGVRRFSDLSFKASIARR